MSGSPIESLELAYEKYEADIEKAYKDGYMTYEQYLDELKLLNLQWREDMKTIEDTY